MSKHVVLLGDSSIHNDFYVGKDGWPVDRWLRRMLDVSWEVTRLARDGSVIASIWQQIEEIPPDATHLVISIGGNNALGAVPMLSKPARTIGVAFYLMADVQRRFEAAYSSMCEELLSLDLPLLLLTIYNPNNPKAEKATQAVEVTALSLFDDVIYRTAYRYGVPLVDLRQVMHSRSMYWNAIEPGHLGGEAIAAAIRARLTPDGFLSREEAAV